MPSLQVCMPLDYSCAGMYQFSVLSDHMYGGRCMRQGINSSVFVELYRQRQRRSSGQHGSHRDDHTLALLWSPARAVTVLPDL